MLFDPVLHVLGPVADMAEVTVYAPHQGVTSVAEFLGNREHRNRGAAIESL
jgi:hypothetical protein